MRILATTDFSTRSQRALRRAGLLAREKTCDLTIVHVVDDDRPARLVELEKREAERQLAERIDTLAELQNIDCRALVVTGEPFDGILGAAESLAADLIVMGSHRKQFLRDIVTGTTIERVIRTSSFPVLMVNNEARSAYRRVLAAVDTVVPSVKAIKTAEALRLLENADLFLIHAFHAVAKGKLSLASVDDKQIEQYVTEERERVLEELKAYFVASSLDVGAWSLRVEEGDPFAVIFDQVQELLPDLVLVGTHGRMGMAKALLGSVTLDVLRSIETDILVVTSDY